MTTKSKIEWTETTWNPVTGCSKISSGCTNCYAERMARRLKAMGQPNYRNEFNVTIHENMLHKPLSWKKPQIIFVNSMSDLFHEEVPISFIRRVFAVMDRADQHIFQVLTKRSERLSEVASKLIWPKNVWMGVSIETSAYAYRLDRLTQVDAAVRFVSFEPLLAPITGIDLSGINWAIAGGESGPGARPMEATWIFDILRQCRKADVPFFFKQWGGTNRKRTGRLLDGKVYDEMPAELENHLKRLSA